eukprot:TRINITY_DN8865_c1_g1_i4.p1 TRINITY_DN8865_c1_g1~~TRINITY_DN8865_c1_g1_i4.p1  ORF type:complete len:595 (+),score=197.43 TRINITY_DN8865_c1_g1_i4:41-1786(+)
MEGEEPEVGVLSALRDLRTGWHLPRLTDERLPGPVRVAVFVAGVVLSISAVWVYGAGTVLSVDRHVPAVWLSPLWVGATYLLVSGALAVVIGYYQLRSLTVFVLLAVTGAMASSLILLSGEPALSRATEDRFASAPTDLRCSLSREFGCPQSANCSAGSSQCAARIAQTVDTMTRVPFLASLAANVVGGAAVFKQLGGTTVTFIVSAAAIVVLSGIIDVYVTVFHPSSTDLKVRSIALTCSCTFVTAALSVVGRYSAGWDHNLPFNLPAEAVRRIRSVLSMSLVFAVVSALNVVTEQLVQSPQLYVDTFRTVRDCYGLYTLYQVAACWVEVGQRGARADAKVALRQLQTRVLGVAALAVLDGTCYILLLVLGGYGGLLSAEWTWMLQAAAMIFFTAILRLVMDIHEALPDIGDGYGRGQFFSVKGIIGLDFFLNIAVPLASLGPHYTVVLTEMYSSLALAIFTVYQVYVWVLNPVRKPMEPRYNSLFEPMMRTGRATMMQAYTVRTGDVQRRFVQGDEVTVTKLKEKGRADARVLQVWISEADAWCPVVVPGRDDLLVACGHPPQLGRRRAARAGYGACDP